MSYLPGFNRTRERNRCAGAVTLALSMAGLAACRDTLDVPPGAVTIHGTVVNEYLQPRAEFGVLIVGHPVLITDENGEFTVDGVTKPYDVAVGMDSERGALVYAGLTREDPLLVLPASPFSSLPYGGYVKGELSGGADYPRPENLRTSVYFESPEVSRMASVAASSYDLSPEWRGATTIAGTVHALQWQFDAATRLPTAYEGYGHRSITLSDGAYLTNENVHLGSPVATGSISGSVVAPDQYVLTTRTLLARFQPSVFTLPWEIFVDSTSGADFEYQVPNVPGVTFAIAGRAAAGASYATAIKTGITADARGIVLSVPRPPTLLAPEDGFSEVAPGTGLAWSQMSDAIYLVSMRYAGSHDYIPPPPNYYVLTADTSTAVPDLRPLGIGLYWATDYLWQVTGFAPFGSVDEVATDAWLRNEGDGSTAASAAREFTVTDGR